VLIVTTLQQPTVKVSTFDFIFSTVVQKTATASNKKIHFSTTPQLLLLGYGFSNKELQNLYSFPNRRVKPRRMRWAAHVARMGEERKVYRVLEGKPEGKRPLGRPTLRWEDGIRKDLRETGWGSVEWIQLAQDRDW
jgi:hypothetical protein